MKRMDRYNTENSNMISRMDKNQDLYNDLSNNSIYTNITDVSNSNAYEIKSNIKEYKTREDYHNMQKYTDMKPIPRTKKELNDFNYLYPKEKNRIYDINSVLEEARKNREGKDELDEKRKLKNKAYNILSNKKALEEYREEKKRKELTEDEEEIRKLMDTIASKTLAGEIDKETTVNLLSDLMATSTLDKIEEEKDLENVTKEEIKPLSQDKVVEGEKKDLDFYTRSMDLSDKDFDFSNDFKEKNLPAVVKIFLFLLVMAIIAITTYIIHQKII